MAYFHFVKDKLAEGDINVGNPNAIKYELYHWVGSAENLEIETERQKDSNWRMIATQVKEQKFGIKGAMRATGDHFEDGFNLPSDGSQSISGYPITEETQNGIRYYFKVSGTIKAVSEEFVFSGIEIGAKIYVDDPIECSFKTKSTLHINYNGEPGLFIELTVINKLTNNERTEYVKVFDLPDGDNKVVTAWIESTTMYRALPNYHRTTYIPILSLTNGVGNSDLYCVGYFKKDTSQTSMPRILYFNDKLEVVKTVTYQQIADYLERLDEYDVGWLDVSTVNNLAPGGAEYVVFVSKYSDEDTLDETDAVHVGGICFQLFNMSDSYFEGGNTPHPYLSVRAIGNGIFYTDSKYSKPEKYERVFAI